MQRLVAEMAWPTSVLLGPGVVERVGRWCRAIGPRKPLLIVETAALRAGLHERIAASLKEAGAGNGLFEQVDPFPTEAAAEAAVEAYLGQGCDGIVSLGSEWTVDTAKLAALLATHERPLARYDVAAGGERLVTGRLPPHVAITTAAGPGAEASARTWARLREGGRACEIHSPALIPTAAICDPELTFDQPPAPTAWAGMDAITRCIEAFCATGFHPLADALAIDGIARGLRGLRRAVQDPRDEAGRLDLMIAAIAGAAAGQKGAGACAAIARAGEAVAGVRHGLMAGICLPLVVEYNRPAIIGRLAKIAVAMGEPADGREERMALTVVERLVEFGRAVKLPAGLKDVGLRQEQLEVIAETAAQDRALSTNPRALSRDDLLGLLYDAW